MRARSSRQSRGGCSGHSRPHCWSSYSRGAWPFHSRSGELNSSPRLGCSGCTSGCGTGFRRADARSVRRCSGSPVCPVPGRARLRRACSRSWDAAATGWSIWTATRSGPSFRRPASRGPTGTRTSGASATSRAGSNGTACSLSPRSSLPTRSRAGSSASCATTSSRYTWRRRWRNASGATSKACMRARGGGKSPTSPASTIRTSRPPVPRSS